MDPIAFEQKKIQSCLISFGRSAIVEEGVDVLSAFECLN